MFKVRILILTTSLIFAGCATSLANTSITPTSVIKKFQLAGLEAVHPTTSTPFDYNFARLLADKGSHFKIPSLGDNTYDGHVLVFSDLKSLRVAKDFEMRSDSDWTFVNKKKLVMVRLSSKLPSVIAQKYQKIVISL